jgi:hypothetical protein
MKFSITLLFCFAFCCVALADIVPPPAASQAEVNAGVVGSKFVSPKTLGGYTSSLTNSGMTQAQAQNSYASGSNIFTGTFKGTGVITNLENVADIGLTNPATVGEGHFTVGATAAGGYVIIQSSGKTNGVASFVEFVANKFLGDGSGLTNIPGSSLQSPLLISQLNAGTIWATNVVYPTNTLGGTALDFSIGEATSNIVGSVSFSSVANLTAGAINRCVRTLINKTGSDQTLSIATGWNQGVYDTYTITNNTVTEVFAKVQPGVYTNVYVKQTRPH